jgi:hypothetical protein
MTGPFRKAIDEIAIRAAANGGPTEQDLLEAIIAGHDEAEMVAEVLRKENKEKAEFLAAELRLQHQESLNAIAENRKLLAEHLGEALIRDERIAKLEAYKEDAQRTCADRVKAYVDAEHAERHGQHMEEMHALDEESYDMRKAWRTIKWALVILAGGVLVALADQIGHLIFGGAT